MGGISILARVRYNYDLPFRNLTGKCHITTGFRIVLSFVHYLRNGFMTQIGLMLEGQAGLTWARWQAILKAAEDYGFQCVFRSDHFTIGPPDEESLETW